MKCGKSELADDRRSKAYSKMHRSPLLTALAILLWQVGTVYSDLVTVAGAREAFPDLALHWAPVHYQDVAVGDGESLRGKSDYATRIDYDGDDDLANNWENLPNYSAKAACYYSVVETDTHWHLVYAFYHPRDWKAIGKHENDLEGLLLIVERPLGEDFDQRFGTLKAMVTIAHNNFYSFVPADGGFEGSRAEDIDGVIEFEEVDGVQRPVTAQEAKGHGLKAHPHYRIKGNPPDGIRYVPSLDVSEEPEHPNDRDVKYLLVDIFGDEGLWKHRENRSVFTETGELIGNNGRANAAHAPWRWDDRDDGESLTGGELAVDPAKLGVHYFSRLGNFSRNYTRNGYIGAQEEQPPGDQFTLEKSIVLIGVWPPTGGDDRNVFSKEGRTTGIRVRSRLIHDDERLSVEVAFACRENRRNHTEFSGRQVIPIFRAPDGRTIATVNVKGLKDIDFRRDIPGENHGLNDIAVDETYWRDLKVRFDTPHGDDGPHVGVEGNLSVDISLTPK